MKKLVSILALLVIVMTSGCHDDKKPLAKTEPGTNSVIYADLKPSDVLVSVNGESLTKEAVERQISLDAFLFHHKGVIGSTKLSPQVRVRLAKRTRDQQVSRLLLLNAAKQAKLAPDAVKSEIVRKEIVSTYGNAADAGRFDALTKGMPEDLRNLLENNVRDAAMIDAFIEKSGGDRFKVQESEIDEIIKRANDLRQKSIQLLARQREIAQQVYDRLKKGEDFDKVAAISDTAEDDEHIGFWGEFSLGELERMYPDLVTLVSRLGEGEYSKPIEREDAIYIIRLKSRVGVGRESVVTLEPERLTLQRIVFKLPIMYEAGTRDEIRQGTMKDRQNEYQSKILLPKLLKDAQITYPCGKVDFKVKRSDKR